MKRIVALITILVLLAFPTAFAATSVTTVHDFEIRFAAAALITESSHYLNGSNENRNDGEVNDVIQATYNESELLQLSVTHGTEDVVSILAMYLPDGDSNHAADYILLISEALFAAGITDSTTDTGDILEQLGMMTNLDDGAKNKITINGINVGYMVSSSIGIWFYIEV